ncbi:MULTISPECIES: AsnC family protein [unclassified Pseudomonas]|uniref:siroheme decarboxylase subunit beta n=1 Tax=unclassified Pseudomonas TaxID=196821 RepID=UPI002AC91BF8|nr:MULTISPECIES: AsnC family protein [unclassified Pseudomonas]MEB0046685.1 AsnC family protein [Pseudomonas sp. Dout3]MEB0098567.1 AsnC family protein [Pseudomonas sp. DC1.2]WPX56659.1 AsnC family protein [Pseudomonas sp. DC1.2]
MKTGLTPGQALALRRHLEGGLPLVSRPYQTLAERINADEDQVLGKMRQWHAQGLFRRVGLVLNHRALGFTANAMLVLDVPDALIDEVGQRLGRAHGITLCYQRPRRFPQWRYNLFCMVHGRHRDQVETHIQALLNEHLLSDLPHQVLFSTHAFKQCGARFSASLAGAPHHG